MIDLLSAIRDSFSPKHQAFFTNFMSSIDLPVFTRLIDLYRNGDISQNELIRLSGVNHVRLRSILRSAKISIRGRKKHNVDSTYFDNIDTFYKAYFLGWLASDGCISATRDSVKNRHNIDRMGKITLSIQERDCYIVERLKEELGFSGLIKNMDRGTGRQRQCKISFCDQYMAQTLYRYGLTDSKSFTYIFPDIPDQFVPAFILGYFDGDGSVHWGIYANKGRNDSTMRQSFSIISSVPFADTLYDILANRYDIFVFTEIRQCKGGIVKSVKAASLKSLIQFYRLVYADAPFCLKRKRDKFDEIFREQGVTDEI